MAKKFWVNNYFIDVNRNQIQHQKQTTAIPPKALKVLEVLASRAGDVVGHDELMDIVWQDSVVGPNTLQRAIAQLRKAFGDDSKQQAFIKTHAKKGYSLEANVRWEYNEANQSSNPRIAEPKSMKTPLIVATIVTLVVLVFALRPSEPQLFNLVTPLTASDEQEYNASYSPDGKYLVFNRYMGQCESHLWAKDLTNNQEQRLSTEPGHYSQLSWSSDGSQLAFIMQSDCSNKPEQGLQCWQLQTLDFAQAWNGRSENLLRYDCANVKTTHPTWLNDGRIALLQYPSVESNKPELVIYNSVSNDLTKIPLEQTGRIYSLTYSRQSGLLATMTLEQNNSHVLRTLDLTGDVQSTAEITPTQSHSVYAQFPIKFFPDGQYLLTHVEGKIYRLTTSGNLTLLHPRTHSGLWNPSYHPNQDKFAVTYGTKDFDIGFLDTSKEQADIDIFSRSTSIDVNAKFQPFGDLISFVSKRSGLSQIWIIEGSRTYQLTNFDQGLKSSRYDWAPDGQSIAVNVDNQLALVKLDGSVQTFNSKVAVNALMPWTIQDKILVTDNQADKHQLYSIDVNSGETKDLQIHNVLWAADNGNNQIVYADQQSKVWLHSNDSTHAISALDNKLSDDYLLLKDGELYGIDNQAKLWQYKIATNDFSNLNNMNGNINYISDIRGEQILATKFIGGRRELVEYSQH